MEHIIKEIMEGLTKLPKSFGANPFGGILVTLIVLYALYLSAPIVSQYLKVEDKVKIEKIEEGPNKSGTYKVNGNVVHSRASGNS